MSEEPTVTDDLRTMLRPLAPWAELLGWLMVPGLDLIDQVHGGRTAWWRAGLSLGAIVIGNVRMLYRRSPRKRSPMRPLPYASTNTLPPPDRSTASEDPTRDIDG